ncbi:MAG TPA: hypothetical protein VN811_08320 [Thermoanaerobaculia bacterium]|nr:hypothetical protein [Thermoanaerobaculia bacterium]
MKQLSREHQAVLDQKVGFAAFRPVVEDEQSLDLLRFYDSFDGAVSAFILTELHIRQADRCKALGVLADYQKHSAGAGAKQNSTGLSYLETAQTHLDEFRKALKAENPVDKGFSRQLNETKTAMKEALAQVEIKGTDAQGLGAVIDEVSGLFAIGATSVNVFVYVGKKLDELKAMRRTPGRGAETNIAVWKLVAAAVLLALGSWVVYKCYYSPWRCSKKEKAIYNSILAVAIVTFGACE